MKIDELKKNSVRRFLSRGGIRLQKSKYLPFSYDRKNYPDLSHGNESVIFDVGANIGQSSEWYSIEFPQSRIFAFEPFQVIFKRLSNRFDKHPRISVHQIALSDCSGEARVQPEDDELCQTRNIVASNSSTSETSEKINITTIDDFAKANNVNYIHILKTDTEGFDLQVLKGARDMLSAGRIQSVISEATIIRNDLSHTSLQYLQDELYQYGFKLKSLLDLHHDGFTGDLLYFNALFTLDH